MSAIISLAVPADVPQLAELLMGLFIQEADFTPDRKKQQDGLRMIVDSPNIGVVLAARDDDRIVGMVTLLRTISTAEGGPVCWLEDMVVHPDHRSGGLGTRLLQSAMEYARANGLTRITLLTDQSNSGSVRFYGRQGFELSSMVTMRRKIDPGISSRS